MEAILEAVRRDTFGKNEGNRLRMKGQIPATVYGGADKQPESLSVDPKELSRLLHSKSGANTLISLKIDGGGATQVLVKEYQLHPVSHTLLHADFYRVAMDKLIKVTVPVHLVGEAKGVKIQGGIIDFVHRELSVECLPADIPQEVAVDVTELMLYDGIRVRDVQTGGKWKALSDADMLIVHVIAAKTEAEPAAAEAAPGAAATAEPEVIKKGKTDKDDEK